MGSTNRIASVTVVAAYPYNVKFEEQVPVCCQFKNQDCIINMMKSAIEGAIRRNSDIKRRPVMNMARRILDGSAKLHVSSNTQYQVGDTLVSCSTITIIYGLRTQFRPGRTGVAFIQIVDKGEDDESKRTIGLPFGNQG